MQGFSSGTPDSCTICMGPLAFPICRLECSHTYCLPCIEEWCRNNNSCPLCNQNVKIGTKVDQHGNTSEIPFEAAKLEKKLSLDCLDHSYFQQELSKLIRNCYEIEIRRFKQRNSKGLPSEWRALQHIKTRLETLKKNLDNFVRFDPNDLLNEIYELSSHIDLIKIGELPEEYYEENNYVEEISDDEDY